MAAYYEATELAGFSIEEGRQFFGGAKGMEGKRKPALSPLAPNEASALYLDCFRKLA